MNKIIRFSIPFIIAFLFLGMLIWLVGASSRVTAAPSLSTTEGSILVTTLVDELNTDGDCSLREAIHAANTNLPVDACPAGDSLNTDTIIFDGQGIILVTSQFSVTYGGPLMINGAGAITISGGDSVRIFYVTTGTYLMLQSLTLEDGYAGQGGCIYNLGTLSITNSIISGSSAVLGGIYNQSTLTIISSTLSGNDAIFGGGIESWGTLTIINSILSSNSAVYDGGGIYNRGSLEIIDSTLSGNNSVYTGGGIKNWGTLNITNSNLSGNSATGYHQDGGGIDNEGVITITNSTLSGNYASGNGGAIGNGGTLVITNSIFSDNNANNGGGIFSHGALTVSNSTISGNSAVFEGGGIDSYNGWGSIYNTTLSGNNAEFGGGIINYFGILSIINSTLSGNSVSGNGGGIDSQGSLEITNSTISNNSAGYAGGGIINYYHILTSTNSIVSGNSAEITGTNCIGIPIIDSGNNIEDLDTCGFNPANGSKPNTDPMLDPLQDNGGPTWTHALLPGSPAIDAGDDAQCPSTDQRGVLRPIDGNGDGNRVCDIGSYEFEYGAFLYPSQQNYSGEPSDTLEYNIHLYNLTNFTDTYDLEISAYNWDTTLSTDLIGPLSPSLSQTFTTTVTIPLEAPWYLTDTVVITAASVTSPTIIWDTARVTTQAYAPPEISSFPQELTSTQYAGEVVT